MSSFSSILSKFLGIDSKAPTIMGTSVLLIATAGLVHLQVNILLYVIIVGLTWVSIIKACNNY